MNKHEIRLRESRVSTILALTDEWKSGARSRIFIVAEVKHARTNSDNEENRSKVRIAQMGNR